MNKGGSKKLLNIYAFYQGEEFITEGTIYQIEKYTGIKTTTLRTYGTKKYKNETQGGNAKRLIKIDKSRVI